MKPIKEDIIKKWLNDELTPEELKVFKQLDAYKDFIKISENAKHFKAPKYDEKEAFNTLKTKTRYQNQSNKQAVFKFAAAVAAIAIIAFTLFKTFSNASDLQSFKTATAKTENINLPDQSLVSLNAKSTLSYNKTDWNSDRVLNLDGEALFEVKKGLTFKVNTAYGQVEVLGTIFNVKARDYAFEVTCFEGSVQVFVNNQNYILKPNDNLIFKNENISLSQVESSSPDWKSNKTFISSRSIGYVLNEFKNYYDVQFDISNIDSSRIYTGSFSHNDLEIALNSITLPLGLTYTKDGNTIILSNK